MQLGWFSFPMKARGRAGRRRRDRKVILACDTLEGRITPSHASIHHHLAAAIRAHHHAATSTATSTTTTTPTSTSTPATTSTTTTTDSSGDPDQDDGQHSAPSTAITTALTTLNGDVQTVVQSSGATVAELSVLNSAFNALAADGLRPSSYSALQSFESSLVTTYSGGTAVTGNSTLLGQFEALYTSSPTTQQTTDLTNAYKAMASVVTSAGITSGQISTISGDWSALLAAEGSTSTATYPYFNLATGQGGLGGGPGGTCASVGIGGDFGQGNTSVGSTAASMLNGDVQAFEQTSTTTVGDLTTLASDMQAVAAAGYRPTSESALRSFENSLVTAYTGGDAIGSDSTLLGQFEALFTNSSSTASTTALSNAYTAMARAITDSGIASSTITTISGDWSALLAAAGNTSTATYPYFNLITGQNGGFDGRFGGPGGGFGRGGR